MSNLDKIITHISNDGLNHVDRKAENKQQIKDLMLELIGENMNIKVNDPIDLYKMNLRKKVEQL